MFTMDKVSSENEAKRLLIHSLYITICQWKSLPKKFAFPMVPMPHDAAQEFSNVQMQPTIHCVNGKAITWKVYNRNKSAKNKSGEM